MQRHPCSGGFHRLTTMASALSVLRLTLLVLALCLVRRQKLLLACLLATLPLDLFAHRLMRVYDLATSAALILDGAADLAISAVVNLLTAHRSILLQIPAWILFVLAILSLVRNICRIKQAAVL